MAWNKLGETEFTDGSNVKSRSTQDMLRDALARMQQENGQVKATTGAQMSEPEARSPGDQETPAKQEAPAAEETMSQLKPMEFSSPTLDYKAKGQERESNMSLGSPKLEYKKSEPSLMSESQMDLKAKSDPQDGGTSGGGISDYINESPKLRSALLAMGVPVGNMTKQEKLRAKANREKVAAAEEARRKAEEARLARIASVNTSLPSVGNYVSGGQTGSFGTGIAPRGY